MGMFVLGRMQHARSSQRPRDIYVRYPEVLQEGVFLGPDVKILLGTKVAKCYPLLTIK